MRRRRRRGEEKRWKRRRDNKSESVKMLGRGEMLRGREGKKLVVAECRSRKLRMVELSIISEESALEFCSPLKGLL